MSDSGNANLSSGTSKKIGPSSSSGSDEFGRQIAKIAVSQICEATGFHSAQRSSIDALADIAIKYIVELGRASHFYANLAGRTSSNEIDILQGLEDLGSAHGFSSASDAHHCVIGSGVCKEIQQFVNLQEEVPFARSIPKFPIARESISRVPSFAQIGEEPPKKDVPNWLPAFPDAHTYEKTTVWNERETDAREERLEQARQRRKGEKSYLSLHKRIAGSGPSGFVQDSINEKEKGKQVVGSNPFLASPVLVGEKDVPDIAVPSEKRVSVLEVFEPAIEAAKRGSLEYEIEERRGLPNRRPTVKFKFGAEKKSLALPVSLSSVGLGGKNDESWFLRDDEKDDKKRRVNMIFKKATENPHELTQL